MTSDALPLVLTTKLSVPRTRPEAITRDRLNGLLDEGRDRPLTVVCAPAGYGKTTAVVQWLDTLGCERAWVSLDPLDNDPRRLCAHLVAALERVWPGAMAGVQRALLGGSDLIETFVPLLAGVVADHTAESPDERLVIVLDDYHVVDQSVCHQLTAALIDALAAGAQIVIISRTTPELRLARRRAHGTLAEIGLRQLRFQSAETERLLNSAFTLGLDATQLGTVHDRVDGWAAGLALVATALSQDETSAQADTLLGALADARTLDFLAEEVFSQQPPRMQTFLCRTSILERLTPSLCEAVLDDPAARELLSEARRCSLFITALGSDADGEWVRYHPLFADLLRRRLRHDTPELIGVLHRRAAEWCAAHGLPEDAIRHAIAAGDGARAAELLRDSWRALFDERRYKTLRRLIGQLPADRGELGPLCDAIEVRCMGLDDVDLRLVAQRLDALEPHRDVPGVAPIIDHIRVSPYYGDVARALADGWAAWERYPDLAVRRELVGNLAAVLWYAGDHDALRDVVEPYLPVIELPRTRGWALAALALGAADHNDVDRAYHYAIQAVETADSHGSIGSLESHLAYVALGEALRLRGAHNEADARLAHASHLTAKRPGSPFQAITYVYDAQLGLTLREHSRARASARAAREILDRYPDLGVLAPRLSAIETTLARTRSNVLHDSPPTRKEQRVLALLPTDLTTPQIAEQLYLSPATVRSHIHRLYRRLGAHTRDEAVQIARERGLLQTEPHKLPRQRYPRASEPAARAC